MPDNINSPRHYNAGDIEVIQYIEDKLTAYRDYITPYQGYLVGNILKYTSRFPLKGWAEDLQKARKYLDWLIGTMEG